MPLDLTNEREHLLVDTGMCDLGEGEPVAPPRPSSRRGRIDQLEKADLFSGYLDAIFFTAFHWTIARTWKMFTNARYYVQARELEFAQEHLTARTKPRSSGSTSCPLRNCHYLTVDGEYAYNSAITLFPTPGHSVGHQSVALS